MFLQHSQTNEKKWHANTKLSNKCVCVCVWCNVDVKKIHENNNMRKFFLIEMIEKKCNTFPEFVKNSPKKKKKKRRIENRQRWNDINFHFGDFFLLFFSPFFSYWWCFSMIYKWCYAFFHCDYLVFFLVWLWFFLFFVICFHANHYDNVLLLQWKQEHHI